MEKGWGAKREQIQVWCVLSVVGRDIDRRIAGVAHYWVKQKARERENQIQREKVRETKEKERGDQKVGATVQDADKNCCFFG